MVAGWSILQIHSIIAAAFDATPESENWDARADLNNDELVDIADYSIMAANMDAVDSVRLLTMEGRHFATSLPLVNMEYLTKAHLALSGPVGTSVTVTNTRTGLNSTTTLAANHARVDIDWAIYDGVQNVADILRVSATNPISVVAHQNSVAACESTALIPLQSLGMDFVTSGYSQSAARLSITAPYPDTLVTFRLSANGFTHDGTNVTQYNAGVEYTVPVAVNSTLVVKTNGTLFDSFAGSSITSNRPIGVSFAANPSYLPATVEAANPLWETIPSTDLLGKKYVVSSALGTNGLSEVQLVGVRLNTQVTFREAGANSDTTVTLDRGSVHTFTGYGDFVVEGSKPFICSRFNLAGSLPAGNYGNVAVPGNAGRGDPSMAILASTSNSQAKVTVTTPDLAVYHEDNPFTHYVNIVVPAGYESQIKQNGTFIPAMEFTAVGTSGFMIAKRTVSAGRHDFSHEAGEPVMTAISYGVANYDFYSAVGGLSMTTNGGAKLVTVAPTNLQAVPSDEDKVGLTWNYSSNPADLANLEGFVVYASLTGIGGSWTAASGYLPASARSFEVSQLVHNTAYWFKVVPFADDLGPGSNVATATTWDKFPGAPYELSGLPLSSSQIKINWLPDPSGGSSLTYELRTSASANGTFTSVGSVNEPIRTITHTGLPAMTRRYYKVRAGNTRGWSDWSEFIDCDTLDVIPSAPTGLVVTNVLYNQQTLTWQDNSANETAFRLYRSGPNDSNYSPYATVEAGTTTWPSMALKGGKLYKYRVVALNSGGESGFTQAENTTPNPPIPNSVDSFAATALSPISIKLDWVADVDPEVDEFEIQRKVGSTWTGAAVVTVPFGTVTHIVNGLSANTSYTFRIRQKNLTGDGPWTEQSVATSAVILPGEDFSVRSYSVSSTETALYWIGQSGASGYYVYRSSQATGSLARITPNPVNPTDLGPGVVNGFMYLDQNLTTGTEYRYVVTAVVNGHESLTSFEGLATPCQEAIPYHTLSPQLIISKAIETSEDFETGPNILWNVTAPNGVNYSGSSVMTAIASAASGPLSVVGNAATLPGGAVLPIPNDSAQTAQHAGYGPTPNPTGPYRKVEAEPGHRSVSGIITLPDTSGIQIAPGRVLSNSNALDTPYIYSGFDAYNGRQIHSDIGFQYGTPGNPGWKVYGLNKYQVRESGQLQEVVEYIGGSAQIFASGPVNFRLTLPHADSRVGTAVVTLQNTVMGTFRATTGNYLILDVFKIHYSMPIGNWQRGDLNRVRLKRVNSIAQVLEYTNSQGGVVNENAPTPNGPNGGLYVSGCVVPGAAWGVIGSGFKLDDEDWDDEVTFNQGSYPGAPYVTRTVHNEWFVETAITVKTTQN